MKSKIILGLLAASTLAACGGKTEQQSQQTTAQASSDKVLYLSGQLNGTGDKITYYWQEGDGLMPYLTYRALLISDAKGETISPDLAASYEVSEDGKSYSFTLKDNLKWSDGQPLTAEDVAFSVKEALQVSIINGIFPEAFSNIVGATEFKEKTAQDISGLVVEGNKITFNLVQPVGNFLPLIAQFYIFPKHSLENDNPAELHNSAFWSNPVTSGMYKVNKIEPGNFIELGLNPEYEGAIPKITKVYYNYINDPVVAMKDGKTYFYYTNRPEEITQLEKTPGITASPVDILFYRYFIVNLSGIDGKGNSKVADKRVREAILYAIDKEKLAQSLFPGLATLNYTGVPTGFKDFLQAANKYEYNPEKAKALLQEANYPFNEPLVITYYYKDQTSADFMQAIAYQLQEVGIKSEVVQVQSAPTQALFATRKYDIAYKGFSSFGYESWYGEYSSNNTNFANIYNSDTSFDALNQQLAETSDPTKRSEILTQLQQLEQDKLFKLPLYTFKNYIFVNTNKVVLPAGLELGNPYYRYDYKFQDWDIKD